MRYRLHKLVGANVGAQVVEHLERGRTWLDDELLVAYLQGDITFTRAKDRILVEGELATSTKVQCVRSLEMFDLGLTLKLEDCAFALPGMIIVEDDVEMPRMTDELWVDLTETIRAALITAIPINPVSPKYEDPTALAELIDDKDKDWLTIRWADTQHDESN